MHQHKGEAIMIVKYKTTYDSRIERVEALRETEFYLFFSSESYLRKNIERREAKRSDWNNYFDTWEEAKQFLLDRAQSKLDSARFRLQEAQGKYENIKCLTNPETNHD